MGNLDEQNWGISVSAVRRANTQSELVETAEQGQIGRGECSVEHVEVFRMSECENFHPGRPRPLPEPRRATRRYTLNYEEPHCIWCAPTRRDVESYLRRGIAVVSLSGRPPTNPLGGRAPGSRLHERP